MNTPSPPPPPSTNSDIPTPSSCYVDFCLVPVRPLPPSPIPHTPHPTDPVSQIGTSTASVALEVAAVQRLLLASGLKCTMHSAGTTVEGSWDEVMRAVGQAHAVVHAMGVVRVQTSMRVGTR